MATPAPDEPREDRVERLFDEAAALPPPERAAFLEGAARTPDGAPDRALIDEVTDLLATDLQAERYFEAAQQRLAGTADALTSRADTVVGGRVGPWRVEAEVGRGGMGAVYRAVRADGAFEQTAALKLVRPGLADALADRFRTERQILATLTHPGVARLLDGGVTDDGRPWLAMEYVDGEPITAYCDRHRLGIGERLALFVEMCDVVAYAHRSLVVHRDLKPSNVLVTAGPPRQVKLLDFGVATLLADGPASVTGSGVRPYTPGYAAPEQILGLPVTTSTDVYALGVLLSELLTGRRPYSASTTPALVERAVLESDAVPPSQALTALAPTEAPALEERAALRASTGPALRRRLRGDLDRIVLKALCHEPEQRYSSAEALARDVQRHLDGQPVEARPPSKRYRLERFVRRHRVGVAAGSAAVLALALALAAALWQGRVAAQERDRAELVASFLTDLLGEFDPNEAGGSFDPVTVLDQAVRRAESEAGHPPSVQARIYDSAGQIYQNYAQFEEADRLLRRALALRTRVYGRDHPDVAESLEHLAQLCAVRGDHAKADSLYRQALALYERAGLRGSVEAATSVRGLGLVRRAQGDPEAGLALVREALALQQAALGAGDPEILATQGELASLFYNTGAYDEAAALFRRVLRGRRRALGAHPHTAQTLSDYAAVLNAQDDFEGATQAHREALAIRREVFGDDHPRVAQSLSYLGWTLQSQGRAAEAEPLYREALAIRRAAFGPNHTAVANSLLMLGEVLTLQGDAESGLRLEGLAVRTFRDVLGEDHPSTASAELRYAVHLVESGDADTAGRLAGRALPVLREVFGPDHERVQTAEALVTDAPR